MSGHGRAITVAVLIAGPALASDTPPTALEQVVITAPQGATVSRDRMPANIQSANAERIERSQSLDLTDFLNRSFAGVHVNHAQNNPLQPDFNYRGFTASPLLGLPQGLAVYQNGMRANEPFGDTVNWDLLALSAVDSVQLLGGSNPVFGLNALGGALSVRMKDGFSYEGTAAEVYGGSFARRGGAIQTGGNNGRWGYYANLDYFEEDGWRDHSASDALRLFGAISTRGERSSLDFGFAHAASDLSGNGAAPAELLSIDWAQVFTHPDRTENALSQMILEGSFKISDSLSVAGNAYVRRLDTDTFNGDGTIFEECGFGDDEFLVEEDYEDLNGDNECSSDDDAGIEPVRDREGNAIEAEIDDEELDAINNISRREQRSRGVSLQLQWGANLGAARRNDLTVGLALNDGRSTFDSELEVARLLDNRSTSRTGVFADEFRTQVSSRNSTRSVYFIDTLDLSARTGVTLAGRYDSTRIRLNDRSGQSPELDGNHRFERFNPSVGVTFRMNPATVLYGSWSQSARAPTPVELACASEDAPCSLPNAFLADPPLDQVVANSVEIGASATLADGVRWHAGAFHTINRNDILFQTTGGATANVGFFDNVGDTRRAGVELGIRQDGERVHWYLDYSRVEAEFLDAFVTNSPNHPVFADDPGAAAIAGEGKLRVARGSTVPGIPSHQLNAGIDVRTSGRFSVGVDASFRSGVRLRGDEANLLPKTRSYAVANLRCTIRISAAVQAFARVENLFDARYETFGLLGDPGEVFPQFSEPRFLGAGPPRGAWLGVRARL